MASIFYNLQIKQNLIHIILGCFNFSPFLPFASLLFKLECKVLDSFMAFQTKFIFVDSPLSPSSLPPSTLVPEASLLLAFISSLLSFLLFLKPLPPF